MVALAERTTGGSDGWNTSRQRIIAMTADAMQGNYEDCMAAGLGGHMTRPNRGDQSIAWLVQIRTRTDARTDHNPAVIDPHAFDDLQANAGADFVVELVDTFAEEAPHMLAEMRGALADGAAERFRRAAHSLKSNSSTFGATRLAEMARTLELGGLPPDAHAVDALAAESHHHRRAEGAGAAMSGAAHRTPGPSRFGRFEIRPASAGCPSTGRPWRWAAARSTCSRRWPTGATASCPRTS